MFDPQCCCYCFQKGTIWQMRNYKNVNIHCVASFCAVCVNCLWRLLPKIRKAWKAENCVSSFHLTLKANKWWKKHLYNRDMGFPVCSTGAQLSRKGSDHLFFRRWVWFSAVFEGLLRPSRKNLNKNQLIACQIFKKWFLSLESVLLELELFCFVFLHHSKH